MPVSSVYTNLSYRSILSSRIERVATPDPSGSVPLHRARQYLCTERGMYPHPERGMYPHPERGMYPHPERGMYPHPERGVPLHLERGVYPHPERGVPLHRTVNSADRLSSALQQEPSDFAEVLFIFVSVSLCAYLWDLITCLSRTGEWSSPILDNGFLQDGIRCISNFG